MPKLLGRMSWPELKKKKWKLSINNRTPLKEGIYFVQMFLSSISFVVVSDQKLGLYNLTSNFAQVKTICHTIDIASLTNIPLFNTLAYLQPRYPHKIFYIYTHYSLFLNLTFTLSIQFAFHFTTTTSHTKPSIFVLIFS
jgi:hypothetical protein